MNALKSQAPSGEAGWGAAGWIILGGKVLEIGSRIILVLCVMWVVLVGKMEGAEYFTSPDGRPSAAGTEADPFQLAAVVGRGSPLKPGDTNWLRGGTYFLPSVGLEVMVNGSASAPIVFRAKSGEVPVLVGRLELKGDDLWFWGLHVTSGARPDSAVPLSALQARQQAGVLGQSGLNVESAVRARVINCVLYQITEHALIWGHSSSDSEITGCLILNSCLLGSDNARGEAVYAQNLEGLKRFRQNILLQNVAGGLGMYSANRATVRNFEVTENVFQANGLEPQNPLNCHAGSESPMENIYVSSNVFWNPPGAKLSNFRMSNTPQVAAQLRFDQNLLVHGGLDFSNLGRNFSMVGNDIRGGVLNLGFLGEAERGDARIQGNRYTTVRFGLSVSNQTAVALDATATGFEQWRRQSGKDSDSVWVSEPDAGLRARLFVNPYEAGRGHLVVLNQGGKPFVEVDVSALGWKLGQRFELRAVQNYFGHAIRGVHRGRPIAVPMTGWAVESPSCMSHVPDSSFPEFGVFLLQAIP